MAQGGNFVEGRLRLSAYLRIVRNIPQHQPLRIRRRILESENDENHNNSHNNAEPASTMVSDTRAEAETSNLASGGNEACQSHVVPPASALEAPEAVQNFAYPESDAPATDGASTTERDSFTFPSTPRRSVDVYTAKPDKVDPRLVTSTGRRRLPVNELALVRRTTDISLSDRSEEVPEPRLITEIDPIEDNQNTPFNTAPSAASSSVQTCQSFTSSTSPSTLTIKSPWKIVKPKKLTSRPGARLIPRSINAGLSSLCADGFLASELNLPTRIKQKKKTPSPSKAKQTRRTVPIPAPVGCLKLRSGPLPRPRSISPPNPLFSGDPLPAEESSSLTLVTLRDDIISDEDSNVPRPSIRREENYTRPRRLTDDIVIAQLSAVTAPARRNTDSDEEDDANDHEEASSIATEILEAEPPEPELPNRDDQGFDLTPDEEQHDDSGFCDDYTLLQEQRSATAETEFWSQYGPDLE